MDALREQLFAHESLYRAARAAFVQSDKQVRNRQNFSYFNSYIAILILQFSCSLRQAHPAMADGGLPKRFAQAFEQRGPTAGGAPLDSKMMLQGAR